MHGLFLFFIKKFADRCAATASQEARAGLRSRIERTANYLPDGSCPDSEALGLLEAVSEACSESLEETHGHFGEYVADHLVRVAGSLVDPSWGTLEIVEHADDLIRSLVHDQQEYAAPPVHESVRISPTELHLVYYSRRKMCAVAAGIIKGMSVRFGDPVAIEETACMRRGAPFCSFVIRHLGVGSHRTNEEVDQTIAIPRTVAMGRGDDPGLPDDSSGDDAVPARIGTYAVLCMIARSAMGRVFLARDEKLGHPVAIKVMQGGRAREPHARQQLLREGQAAAAISHPHLLTVYGVGEHHGQPFIVMQHLEGIPLLAYPRPTPILVALRIGREIASGLAAAHGRGLIHRNIQPQSIFLEAPDHTVRIINFGMAWETEGDSSLPTADGSDSKAPAYLSPERIGNDPLDARSDLFGLGVVLYELLSGRLPYQSDSTLTLLASIARGEQIPLAQAAAEIPPEVSDFVMRLMARDPEDRPTDAQSVEATLASLERQCAAG